MATSPFYTLLFTLLATCLAHSGAAWAVLHLQTGLAKYFNRLSNQFLNPEKIPPNLVFLFVFTLKKQNFWSCLTWANILLEISRLCS